VIEYRQTSITENLALRARLIHAIRGFFSGSGFLEVETPVRIPAPAPEAYIDAVGTEGWYLQTSPELCMKRLLSAGYPRIFQICRCFRHSERGDRHLPEFTILEWYESRSDYTRQMDLCEDLLGSVAHAAGNRETLVYRGQSIDLTKPWDRITVQTAFQTHASMSMEDALSCDRFDEVMACEIEPRLGRQKPIFMIDYPASRAALSRLKTGGGTLAERFELYIAGLELCNTFSELTDPEEQRRRFERERDDRRDAEKPVYPMPEKFLSALADMPEAAGSALGIDRLTMLFADTARIDDVVAFTPEEL
jgi:lysyl-tRNA synthetase class 2